ncbi:MAG: prephenate dehydrogenase/arogenate dehydrogenase family protein [Ardenticatenales bacterium]|nr:prephenate dehydrogenase/arogenate dehydrogenase family protein [Ardenticatenales bacterium]
MKAQRVSIIGLDRIGASFALALKRPELKLKRVGFDLDAPLAKEAEKKGIIDESRWNLIGAVAGADIVILSLPAFALETTLRQIGQDVQEHTLILDASDAKGLGQKWAAQYLRQGHYVGVKPVLAANMLADGRVGLEAATPDLFRDSVMCLMPAARAEEKAVETAINIGLLVGAQPYFLDPHEYDSLAQGVDTIPGLLSAALFRAITQATGWRDILRFAGPTFALGTAALRQPDLGYQAIQNKAATLRWLESIINELRAMQQQIYEGESETLDALLQQLAIEREEWLRQRARNDWQEFPLNNIDPLTMRERLLGSRRKKSDN